MAYCYRRDNSHNKGQMFCVTHSLYENPSQPAVRRVTFEEESQPFNFRVDNMHRQKLLSEAVEHK